MPLFRHRTEKTNLRIFSFSIYFSIFSSWNYCEKWQEAPKTGRGAEEELRGTGSKE
jgi:hypothetical protein